MAVAGVLMFDASDPSSKFMIGLPVTVLVGLFVLVLRQRRHRAIRKLLYESGTATHAVVTKSARFTMRGNYPKIHEARWKFRINDTVYEGSRFSSGLGLERLSKGDYIWIVFDLDDPSKNAEGPPM